MIKASQAGCKYGGIGLECDQAPQDQLDYRSIPNLAQCGGEGKQRDTNKKFN